MTRIRSYSELRRIDSFEGRYDYLALRGQVGDSTFGFDRYVNQLFYRSRQWRHVRDEIIVRDGGCDLGVPGFEIHDRPTIHHMNPMTLDDIAVGDDDILNPEFLILVSHKTHNAIHYGNKQQLPKKYVERRPGDTRLWNRRR